MSKLVRLGLLQIAFSQIAGPFTRSAGAWSKLVVRANAWDGGWSAIVSESERVALEAEYSGKCARNILCMVTLPPHSGEGGNGMTFCST